MLICNSCQNESTDQIITQEKFDAPSIEFAKQFVNNNRPNDINLSFKNIQSNYTSVTHWEGSKTKKYKQTEELDVDILYTPIYVNSPRTDIKGFLASTEHNGVMDSRKIYILYKSNDLSNGLNAYVLIYRLNGSLQLAYNFVNGQSIPLPEGTTNDSILNKSINCDHDISNLTDEEFEIWWASCAGVPLDEVIVTGPAPLSNQGPNGGSNSAFNDWNSSQWVGVSIPALTDPNSNYNNGSIGNTNINWYNPNVTVANAPSITAALEVLYNSAIANWLRDMEQTNQQLLNEIAAYLNANRTQNPFSDFSFNQIQPEQFPISNEAIGFVNLILDDEIVVEGPDIEIENMEDYLGCFDTSQSGEAATVTIYVDEPVDGEVDIIGPDAVGHTFVSISQGLYTASYGFYPQSGVASVIFPDVTGAMGDNSNTDYNVSLTINNVSPNDLQQIIDISISYSNSDYSLIKNNCTDMGIYIGNLAGYPIPECNANPLVFFGSTPGRLGKFIREIETPLPNNIIRNSNGGTSPSNNCN